MYDFYWEKIEKGWKIIEKSITHFNQKETLDRNMNVATDSNRKGLSFTLYQYNIRTCTIVTVIDRIFGKQFNVRLICEKMDVPIAVINETTHNPTDRRGCMNKSNSIIVRHPINIAKDVIANKYAHRDITNSTSIVFFI